MESRGDENVCRQCFSANGNVNWTFYAFVYLVFRQIHKAAIVWRKNTYIANFLQI